MNQENKIKFRFFEKPTTTPVTVLERSGMEENSKMKILSNDLMRRLLNTQEDLDTTEKTSVIDGYAQKLLNSGYNLAKTRKIVLAGIKGYSRKIRKCKEEGRPVYRTAKESSGNRNIKKLLGPQDWFKRKRSRQEEDSEDSQEEWTRCWKKIKKTNDFQEIKTRSVIFVEHSKGGGLAKKLREVMTRFGEDFG